MGFRRGSMGGGMMASHLGGGVGGGGGGFGHMATPAKKFGGDGDDSSGSFDF